LRGAFSFSNIAVIGIEQLLDFDGLLIFSSAKGISNLYLIDGLFSELMLANPNYNKR